MSLKIGAAGPDFVADTTHGALRFRQWNVGTWVILFTFERDVDAVLLAEFGQLSRQKADWRALGVDLIGLGVKARAAEARWSAGTERSLGLQVNFPLVSDEAGTVGRALALDEARASTVVLDPLGIVRFVRHDPAGRPRDFAGVLEAVRVLQLAERLKNGAVSESEWGGEDEGRDADARVPEDSEPAAARAA